MNIKDLKVDEDFKSLLPPLSEEQFSKLEQDIVIRGVLDPILIWNGYVTDGHNRLEICKKHGITDVDVKNLPLLATRSDVMQWIIDHQLGKRNLTKSQFVKSYQKVEEQIAREARERQVQAGQEFGRGHEKVSQNFDKAINEITSDRTDEQIANKIGVSRQTYRDMKLVVNHGTVEQVDRMDKGGKGNGVSAIAKEIKENLREKEEKKMCQKCGRILPISSFYRNKSKATQVQDWCRECESKHKRDAAVRSTLGERVFETIKRVKSDETDTSVDLNAFLDELSASVESFINDIQFRIQSNSDVMVTTGSQEKVISIFEDAIVKIQKIEKELINE